MTDYHTHILPKMDDGASSAEESLALLRLEYAQHVTEVALTPHYDRRMETADSFLSRRQASCDELRRAMDALPEQERVQLPQLLLGAEVTWTPHMAEWTDTAALCYEGSDYLLLELPFSPWNASLFTQLYDLMNRTGITPVIAHIDRYWGGQRKELLAELLSMGLPLQLSAESLMHLSTRRKALQLVQSDAECMLISDTHGLRDRKPNLAEARDILLKKCGGACPDVFHFSCGAGR